MASFNESEKALLKSKGFDVAFSNVALMDTLWITKLDDQVRLSNGDNSKPKHFKSVEDALKFINRRS